MTIGKWVILANSVVILASGLVFGLLLERWEQGTYCLVLGGLGLWAADRWDDITGAD